MSRLATFTCERCGIKHASSLPSRFCGQCAKIVRAERLREYQFQAKPTPITKEQALREIEEAFNNARK